MCSPTIDGSCIVMVRMSVCWFPISYYVVKRFFHKLNRVKHKLYHLFKNLNFHLYLIDGLSDTAKSVCEQEFNNIARVFGHLGTPNLTFEESKAIKPKSRRTAGIASITTRPSSTSPFSPWISPARRWAPTRSWPCARSTST